MTATVDAIRSDPADDAGPAGRSPRSGVGLGLVALAEGRFEDAIREVDAGGAATTSTSPVARLIAGRAAIRLRDRARARPTLDALDAGGDAGHGRRDQPRCPGRGRRGPRGALAGGRRRVRRRVAPLPRPADGRRPGAERARLPGRRAGGRPARGAWRRARPARSSSARARPPTWPSSTRCSRSASPGRRGGAAAPRPSAAAAARRGARSDRGTAGLHASGRLTALDRLGSPRRRVDVARAAPGSGARPRPGPPGRGSRPRRTENCGPAIAATAAASASPRRGPLVTTRMWIEATRPRSSSGVSSWTIAERSTALKTSAAPARARKKSASAKLQAERPKAVIARPQAATATITARPGWRIRPTQPDKRGADEGARCRRRGQEPDARRADAEDVERERREERRRHPEDHRHEVDDERARGRSRRPPHEAQPLLDRGEAGPRRTRVGRDRGDEEEGHDRRRRRSRRRRRTRPRRRPSRGGSRRGRARRRPSPGSRAG